MGTVLSLFPGGHGCRPARGKEEEDRRAVLLRARTWKKRLLAARAWGRAQKPSPGRLLPRGEPGGCRRLQASTGQLLACLSHFVCRRCVKLKQLSSDRIVRWFRNVDRALQVHGWQKQSFLSPASLVFVYLLCRTAVDEDTASERELHATFLTCLYLAYSYLGSEISYPLKPFLVESSPDVFWERTLEVIEDLSADMMRINAEPQFFTEVFQDLKRQAGAPETKAGEPGGSGEPRGEFKGQVGEEPGHSGVSGRRSRTPGGQFRAQEGSGLRGEGTLATGGEFKAQAGGSGTVQAGRIGHRMKEGLR